MSASAGNLYIDNDNTIVLEDVYDTIAAEFIDDATVAWTLKDAAGATITSGSLTYVPLTDATYRGNIEEDVDLTQGAVYELTVTVTASGDRYGEWNHKYPAKKRQNT